MFIEVKHFSEQAGRIRLTRYELKKAELEGDKYYIYVVTGLIEVCLDVSGDFPPIPAEGGLCGHHF